MEDSVYIAKLLVATKTDIYTLTQRAMVSRKHVIDVQWGRKALNKTTKTKLKKYAALFGIYPECLRPPIKELYNLCGEKL